MAIPAEKVGVEKVAEKLAEKRRALGRGLESLLPGPRVVPSERPDPCAQDAGAMGQSASASCRRWRRRYARNAGEGARRRVGAGRDRRELDGSVSGNGRFTGYGGAAGCGRGAGPGAGDGFD